MNEQYCTLVVLNETGACMEDCCPGCGKQLANLTSQRQHLHLRSCRSRPAAVWQPIASPQNLEQQLPCKSEAPLPLKRKALSNQVAWLTPIRTASQQASAQSQPPAGRQPQQQLERRLLSMSVAGRPASSCSSSTASAEAEPAVEPAAGSAGAAGAGPAVEPAAGSAGAAGAAPHCTEQQRWGSAATAHGNAAAQAAHARLATNSPSPSVPQTSPQKEGLPDARHRPEADASGSSMAACLHRLGLSSYWPAFKQVSPDSSATRPASVYCN